MANQGKARGAAYGGTASKCTVVHVAHGSNNNNNNNNNRSKSSYCIHGLHGVFYVFLEIPSTSHSLFFSHVT